MADIIIKRTLKEAGNNKSDFMTGFLKFQPIPLDENNVPLYSIDKWLEVWIDAKLMWAYNNGMSTLSLEAKIVRTDLIT